MSVRDEEKKGIADSGLFSHLERVRLLSTSCPTRRLFPLPGPTPRLRRLVVHIRSDRYTSNMIRTIHLLASPTALTKLFIRSVPISDPLRNIQPDRLQELVLKSFGWNARTASFLSKCQSLRLLHLTEGPSQAIRPLHLELPELEVLRLEGSCAWLALHFEGLQRLQELSVVAGRVRCEGRWSSQK